jgi:hypothetical protein
VSKKDFGIKPARIGNRLSSLSQSFIAPQSACLVERIAGTCQVGTLPANLARCIDIGLMARLMTGFNPKAF